MGIGWRRTFPHAPGPTSKPIGEIATPETDDAEATQAEPPRQRTGRPHLQWVGSSHNACTDLQIQTAYRCSDLIEAHS